MRFIQIGQKGDHPGKLVGPDHGFLAELNAILKDSLIKERHPLKKQGAKLGPLFESRSVVNGIGNVWVLLKPDGQFR